MNFVLNRRFTLRTTKGHIINFEPGVPTFVPPKCWEDAASIGAVPENPEAKVFSDEPVSEQLPAPQGMERESQIRRAIEKLEKRNQRGDFTASGSPHTEALNKILEFKVSIQERDEVWKRMRWERAEANDAKPAV